MTRTRIEWADEVWNPLRGCSRISKGCENCYAERQAARFSGPGLPFEGVAYLTVNGARWTGQITELKEKLNDPRRWVRPRRVFVNSMSDMFHEKVSDNFIKEVFVTMAKCPQHKFMILTKRAERMCSWFSTRAAFDAMDIAEKEGMYWPLDNVWLGVSVEDQAAADSRLPFLIGTQATTKFVSAEPLIGPVDLTKVACPVDHPKHCEDCAVCHVDQYPLCYKGHFNALEEGVDWVIVGCETGPSSRDMKEDWVRELRDQCQANATAFFYKQAKDKDGRKEALPSLDGKQWTEFPDRGGARTRTKKGI